MIFQLKNDFEKTYSLLIDGVELHTKMPTYKPRFFAKARLQEWVQPEASFYPSSNFEGLAEELPDLTIWATGVVVLSPKAYGVLSSELSRSGEFLPISIHGVTYYLFNTLYIIPDEAMDKSKAVEVIDTGVHFGQTNIIFDETFLANEKVLVFKSDTNKLLHSFCTEDFKKIYEDHGFKGLVFEPA
jgi:hypothetical protein